MEKTLIIDGRRVKFKATAGVMMRYKAQFNRDWIKDIMSMINHEANKNNSNASEEKVDVDITKIDLMTFYNLAWTLAKTADNTIPEPLEWLDSFSVFPLDEVLPEIVGLAMDTMRTTKTSKDELKKTVARSRRKK